MSHQDTPGPARVLVVDDHRISRQFTVAALRQTGCTVKQSGSLENGLETALEWLPDTVITDWNLGDGNGYELLSSIKCHWPAGRGLPRFTLLTGERRNSLPPGAFDGSFDRVLHKPCSAEELAGLCAPRRESRGTPGRGEARDIERMFRSELKQSLPALDQLIANNCIAGAAEITHRMVAGGVLCGSEAIEAAFRRLDTSCRTGVSPARMVNDWCRARTAARDWLAGVQRS